MSSAEVDLGADGQSDTATVQGTAGTDNLGITKSAQTAAVTGLPYAAKAVNGDGGNDVLIGGPGVDTLDGGNGDDVEIQN